jgi:mRNA interferase RelE/StbE
VGTGESEAGCTIRSYSAGELRSFTQLKNATLYRRLRADIDGLALNARPSGCVKLAGAPDLYRIRVGDYRVVYQVKDTPPVVLVLSIGQRREIYRG